MRENDWTKVLGWPGYRVYQHEIKVEAQVVPLFLAGVAQTSIQEVVRGALEEQRLAVIG